MKTIKKLATIILLIIGASAAYAQNVTISAGDYDCNWNNFVYSSPSSINGDGSQQKVTITFKQYQCVKCKQIAFTKNGSAVNLVQDAASGEFTVTGVQRNPLPVSNFNIAGNILVINDFNDIDSDCGWNIGDISITMYLKYESATNTLYYSSNPIGSGGGNPDDGNGNENGNNNNNNTTNLDDLILGKGDKQFIFHTQQQQPNDPPVVFIAPKLPNSTDFDWSKQIILKNDGSLLMSAGNLGVGTTDPKHKLDVNGTIRAREVVIDLEGGADFVFDENYVLRPLDEVHNFIQANKHLPEIPSAADMVKNGLDMGEFQIKLLQKIEELTLYIIEQERRIKELENK